MTAEAEKHFAAANAAKTRKPFVPFTIVLRNGKRYEILDRWDMALADGNPSAAVLLDQGRSYDFFSWRDVVAVEMLSPAV
jgi:hypothetical protein